jgi:mannose-6-phosphate isomerase
MLYPLRFKEIFRNYGFGARWIAEAFEKTGLPEDHRVAETWEVCDRPGESSLVLNGPLAGKSLHELIAEFGEELLGRDIVARLGSRFPLLIKLLDASHVLNEQAHHSDALAAKHNLDDPGKTEAWYMLRVRDGATVHIGQASDEENVASLQAALLDGDIRDHMREYAVSPGDAFLLYAGTMHYCRGGALFYEIMQNSDVYIGLQKPDEGLPEEERAARAQDILEGIHLEAGFSPKITPVVLEQNANKRTFVMACEHFVLERLDLVEPLTLESDGARFAVLTQIEASCTLAWDGGPAEGALLLSGQSCLLPAQLDRVIIQPGPSCALLKAYVPNLLRDVVEPLRQAGVADTAIAGLGGETALNPMLRML